MGDEKREIGALPCMMVLSMGGRVAGKADEAKPNEAGDVADGNAIDEAAAVTEE